MADLSKNQSRVLQADRPTTRRSSIIPSRRDTEATQRRAAQDIRSGTRGDVGGAEALMDFARQVNGTTQSFIRRDELLTAKRDNEDAAQGFLDGQSDNVDAAKVKKSYAYSNAVTLQRAQRDWFVSSEKLDNDIKAVIYSDEDPRPEVREAKALALIDKHFQEFALDENKQPRYAGAPAAQRWLASQMGKLRETMGGKAYQLIEERISEEYLATDAELYKSRLLAGEEVDFEYGFKEAPPGVDRKALKIARITVTKDVAGQLKDEASKLWVTDPEKAKELAKRSIQMIDRLTTSERSSGVTPVDVPASAVAQGSTVEPTSAPVVRLSSPFKGFEAAKVTGKIGDKRSGGRSHNGEDYALPLGTPLSAPMGGEVTYKYSKTGGHQAFLTMDNGDVLGVAHLKEKPRVGRVTAEQAFALSGNSGQSTGPHAHMTVTLKNGKKVSPSEYFKNTTATAGQPAMAAADPAVVNPQDVSTEIDGAPLVGGMAAPKGTSSLTPAEIFELRAYKRQLLGEIDRDSKAGLADRQMGEANNFMLRLHGIGAYPTALELQTAASEGRIAPSQLSTLLQRIEADQDELEQESRQAESEFKATQAEADENVVDDVLGSLQYNLSTGRSTATAAYGTLMERANTIKDPKLRAQIVNAGQAVIGDTVSLRVKGPVYQRASRTFTDWRGSYEKMLRGRGLQGKRLDAAMEKVDAQMGAYVTELGKGELTGEQVDTYLGRAEKNLDSWFARQFAPKPAKPNYTK